MHYGQELIKPYEEGDKTAQVERMFDNIAPAYDVLNHRLSWNIDRMWRRKAILQLKPYNPRVILDIATGTGDFAIMAAEMLQPERLVGADISEGMMEIGRKKVAERGMENVISFDREDCTSLSYSEGTFDAVMAAFGIRNFANLERGLGEMYRVMKQNGYLSIVELTRPMQFPMKQLFYVYSHTFLPVYGRLVSHDSRAYSYLTKTIEAFPQGEKMVEILKKVGFREASFRRLTFGICTIYLARK